MAMACSSVHPPCGLGKFPVLVMVIGLVDGSGPQCGTAGSPESIPECEQ